MIEHISDRDLQLAFDGELAAGRAQAVREHAQSCAECEAKWANLAELSGQLAVLQRVDVGFRPEGAAVGALMSRLSDGAGRKKPHWTSRSLVLANSVLAAAVAITCIALLPSSGKVNAKRPAAVYDFEETVPAGYTSLPFADPALPLDDAEVLPVQLSADDLEMMGLSAVDAPQEGVQAEILIGVDGLPRAIRIVE
jgi:hypothetical protein